MSWQQFGQLMRAPLPCVVEQCLNTGAKWYGKWTLSGAIPAGLHRPYDSEEEACEAVQAAGWKRREHREGMSGPHFDRPDTLQAG